jgi:quinoprotein glucose dehydrogenase
MKKRGVVRQLILFFVSFALSLISVMAIFVLFHRQQLRSLFERSGAGASLVQMYHFMIPPLEGINKIPYSIFDPKLAWEAENAGARESLPEFETIPALKPPGGNSNEGSTPSPERYLTWQRSGADLYSSKYSELSQIDRNSVSRLQLAWVYHSNEGKWYGNVETNPIFAEGNIFATTPAGFLVSINAANGSENWRTEIRTPARRGLLWWAGNERQSPRLFVPSADGVYAVAPNNGAIIKEFGTDGRVSNNTSFVAPAVDRNRLIVATMAPTVEAYDVETGNFIWKTSLLDLPQLDGKESARPFTLGGGNPWSGFSLDSVRSTLYVSTGNAFPILYGPFRPGRNRYSNSVVAIDTGTGAIKWSFQEVAHDLWDFDIVGPPVLTTIQMDGHFVDAVVVVTKIGNTIVLDRDSGKPLYDFRLRRAPVSSVPGEQTWPYQPDVEIPEPFAKPTFDPSDVTDIGEEERTSVEAKIKNARFGFFVPPRINEEIVTFGVHGGAEWPGAAVDEATGILYVPSNHDLWTERLFYSEVAPNPVRWTDKTGDAIYQSKCAGCHGVRREGYFDREVVPNKDLGDTRIAGDTAYPSLIGITASRKIDDTAWFYDAHSGVELEKTVSAEEVAAMDRYLSAADHFSDDRRSFEVSYIWQVLLDGHGHPGSKPPWGKITAIDLSTGKKVWSVPFGEYPDLTKSGIPTTGQPNFGGLIVTKGGVVFATGTIDQKVRAFDSKSGVQLWSYDLPAAGSAPPTTYELDGVQYLVVVASGGIFAGFKDHSDAIVAFKLPN